MVYKFREGSRFPVKAQVAGEALAEIEAEGDGHLEPAAVVAAARPEGSPLHPVFEWDDALAAASYREDQARQLIRSVTIVHEESPKQETTRAYVAIPDPERRANYEATAVVVADPDKRAMMLALAFKLLEGVKERFKELSELEGVFREIDRAMAAYEAARAAQAKSPKKAKAMAPAPRPI